MDDKLLGRMIEVRFVHPENAPSPIVLTLFGITIDSKLVHPANVAHSILEIFSGSLTEDRFVQSQYI